LKTSTKLKTNNAIIFPPRNQTTFDNQLILEGLIRAMPQLTERNQLM